MTRETFDVDAGYTIDEGVIGFIGGTGIPGSGVNDNGADLAPIGFTYVQANGATTTSFNKKTAGTGTDKWVKIADQDDIDGIATGTSWRVPALVKDDTVYANLAAAETAVNTGSVDGVTVVDTTRILFTAITGANNNVFVVNGTPGAGATLVEDTLALDGFTIWIQDGATAADTIWVYDGTAWVQRGSGDQTELAFLRAFVGKTAAGSELPTYTSTNVVANNDTLEVAIGKLDAASTGNQIDNLGNTGGVAVVADSVLVDEVAALTWKVYVTETATQDTRVVLINAGHNGNVANDASVIKDQLYSRLRMGNVNGVSFSVDLSGVGAAQAMALTINATNAYDVRVTRTEIISF